MSLVAMHRRCIAITGVVQGVGFRPFVFHKYLIECKYADNRPATALIKFAGQLPNADAIQLVRELRQEEYRQPVSILKGAKWLAELAA